MISTLKWSGKTRNVDLLVRIRNYSANILAPIGPPAGRVGKESMQAKMNHSNNREIAVLLTDKAARSSIPKKQNIKAFMDSNLQELEEAKNLFVVATGMNLPEVANLVRLANNTKRLRGLLIRQDEYQSWITQLLDIADLRNLRNLLVHSDYAVVKRILLAWSYGAQHHLIADAAVIEGQLLLRDCALNRCILPFSAIRDLASIKPEDRNDFCISTDGSRISWSKYDIDINLDSIERALNPEPSKKESKEHDLRIGEAIANLRNQHGLRQTDIEGIDERHLRKIEKGSQRATSRCLKILATAHNLDVDDYLNRISTLAKKTSPETFVERRGGHPVHTLDGSSDLSSRNRRKRKPGF